jgi:hypothetical protein
LVVLLGDQVSQECKTWRAQWEPLFVKSDGYKKLGFRAIYPADSSLLLKQEAWPADLRWILDTFLASPDGMQRGTVTRRFFLVQTRQITFTYRDRHRRLARRDVADDPVRDGNDRVGWEVEFGRLHGQ